MSLLLSLLLGCATEAPDRPDPVTEPPALELPDGTVGDVGDATAPEGQIGRDRHRMTVPQLADSIEQVTGRRWMDRDDDLFAELAPTLGVPDYVERTSESREPDLVFQKLLDDAANAVCQDLVAEEAQGGERLLVGVDLATTVDTDRAGIEAALSAALLRFHGRQIPADDEALGPWVWLFESATNATEGDTAIAWQAVCTALIVHPDFYTY